MSTSRLKFTKFVARATFDFTLSDGALNFPPEILSRIPATRFKFTDYGLLLFIASHPPYKPLDLTRNGQNGPDIINASLRRLQAAGLIQIGDQYRDIISVKTKIPEGIRWDVLERDNFTCQRCGSRRYLSVDHIKPESRGGTIEMSNLQTLCKPCNSAKGNKEERP
jgi:hypothetical protein